MAAIEAFPALAVRSSLGIELWSSSGLKDPFVPDLKFKKEQSKNCQTMMFSSNGQYFAYSNGTVVKILNTSDWSEKCSLSRPKACHLQFSPLGNYLVTWELYMTTKDRPEGTPNLSVYKIQTGEEVFSTIHKKQSTWAPCWSSDESIFALMIGGEAFFYELSSGIEGFKSMARKLGGGKNGSISIAPGNNPPNLAFYVPGTKGTPSMCKLYKYPALDQMLACKSFFQADEVDMMWNKRGTELLLLTTTEVDKTGASYYGKQALHFMSIKSDSCSVHLTKEGPIHAVSWSPNSKEFLVVYGYMPAKATLFNLKCDKVFDFDEAPRNSCYFNDFGNRFGNLRGYVEIWDMKNRIQLTSLQAPDSTHLEWCPTGETFVTATTAPRLRIGNGFKVWHYSGALLHETLWPKEQELLEVTWQKYAEGVWKEKPLSKEKIEGIQSEKPAASTKVYEPPHIRLMKEGKVKNIEQLIPQPSALPPKKSGKSKKQKSRESKGENLSGAQPLSSEGDQTPSKGDQQNKRGARGGNFRTQTRTDNPEKDKRIRQISQKLKDISRLKNRLNNGEHLEANQLTKIKSEAALMEELKMLKVST